MMAVVRLAGLLTQLYAACAASFAQPCVNPVLERARRIRLLLWVCVPVGVLLESLVHPAAAFTMFDPLVDTTQTDSTTWFNKIQGMVTPTFTILGTLEICWAAAIWAFEKDSLNSLAVEVIKKFMFIGFFYTLLQYAGTWIPIVIDTFTQVGQKTVDTTNLTTDSIIGDGLTIAGKLFGISLAAATALWAVPSEALGTSVPGVEIGYMTADFEMFFCLIICMVVVVAYVVVAAQFFTLKIESYILFAAGAIFLGLGSNTWTKEYVSKYLSHAMHTGVRMLVLILTLSITLASVKKLQPPALDVTAMLELLGAALLQAIVAMRAPDMAGALMSGGGAGLTAGSGLGAIRSTLGAAMGGAGKAISAGQGASNLGKAVKAGHELAKSENKTGTAAVVGGLRAAAGEVFKESKVGMKALPGKLASAIKTGGQGMGMGLGQGSMGQGSMGQGMMGQGMMGQGGGGLLGGAGGQHKPGQNPGVFDRANQSLRSRLPGAQDSGAGAAQTTPSGGGDPQSQGNTAGSASGNVGSGSDPASGARGSSAALGLSGNVGLGSDATSGTSGSVGAGGSAASSPSDDGSDPSANDGSAPSAAAPTLGVPALSSASSAASRAVPNRLRKRNGSAPAFGSGVGSQLRPSGESAPSRTPGAPPSNSVEGT